VENREDHPDNGPPDRVSDEFAARRPRRAGLVFRPGEMPALYGDTASVLIIDDDEPTTVVLSTLLTREGYRCTVAHSALDARGLLAAIPAPEFAVALVDVMMPGETGLELAEALLHSQPDIAVVMVTGVDDPLLAEIALEAGASGYIVKPFQLNQVSIAVALASRLRCLEIERRLYRSRSGQLPDLRAIDDVHARLDEIERAAANHAAD
jgi:DNA-binding NtrC family response regulator